MKMAVRSKLKGKRRGTPRLPIGKRSVHPNNSSRRSSEFGIRDSGFEKQSVRPDNSSGPRTEAVSAPQSANAVAHSSSSALALCPAKDAASAPLSLPPALDLRKERAITVKDAAYRSMKSEDTIYKWLQTGRLKGWQLGGPGCNVLVSAASLEEVMRCATRFAK